MTDAGRGEVILRALIAKWRAEATAMDNAGADSSCVTDCADELESILSSLKGSVEDSGLKVSAEYSNKADRGAVEHPAKLAPSTSNIECESRSASGDASGSVRSAGLLPDTSSARDGSPVAEALGADVSARRESPAHCEGKATVDAETARTAEVSHAGSNPADSPSSLIGSPKGEIEQAVDRVEQAVDRVSSLLKLVEWENRRQATRPSGESVSSGAEMIPIELRRDDNGCTPGMNKLARLASCAFGFFVIGPTVAAFFVGFGWWLWMPYATGFICIATAFCFFWDLDRRMERLEKRLASSPSPQKEKP